MTDLSSVPTKEMRAELNRREEETRLEVWDSITKQYGPCPECGAPIRGGEVREVEEHLTATEEWHRILPGGGWLNPPPEYTQVIGADYELTFVCANGHRWTKRETRMFDKPQRMGLGG